jgi:SagB-type dehydrogenase family enzyme
VRRYGARVVSLDDLGEFLFRTARVTGEERVELQAPDGPLELEVAHRPYPGAGALHELEVYVVVARCDGLDRGMYHYEPSRHRLVRLAAAAERVDALLAGAAAGAALAPGDLQLLLVVSARVPRLSWKYEGMAYSVVLKDAGVLLGAMYLAATAMGLSPCAIGNGDCDAFARATGTPVAQETSVAELLLGGAPASGEATQSSMSTSRR